ncbi:hypothetical protein GCM10009775_23510 [Microbacterium aoyamense]|uniref:Uncharacterized protein n=2 Tax=Microbacterium aoyamense TaxID=344166 RepID=A0ABP5B668_9MICO
MFAAATLALLVGCATGAPEADGGEAADPLVSGPVDVDVPDECRETYPLAVVPADIADVELQPGDWPEPPEGSTLCATSGSIDGASETASYATTQPFEEVAAFYEAALSGYETYRSDGAESGTGYATLDGAGSEVDFQVRESDGGFLVVFARAG